MEIFEEQRKISLFHYGTKNETEFFWKESYDSQELLFQKNSSNKLSFSIYIIYISYKQEKIN